MAIRSRARARGGFRFAALATPSSDVVSLTILDATRLPDGADAAVPNGWVAKLVVPWNSGYTFDPTKIVLTATRKTFGADGATGTRQVTIRGSAVVRKQYAANTLRLSGQVGLNLEVYFALSDFVYAGEIITATANAGYYSGVGGAVTGPISTVTNNSTRAYGKPQVAFLNLPGERSTNTLYVEVVAGSVYARAGQQVACVKFYAKDSSGHSTPFVGVNATTLSTIVTGNPALTPEVYAATLDCSGLTQGDLCTAYAVVYGFDGNLPFNIETDGTPWPTMKVDTGLRFVCDKAGTYGGVYAYVSPNGNDGTGTATRTLGGATDADVMMCRTIEGALAKIRAFNAANSVPAHNDHGGGIVRLASAGGATVHVIGDTSGIPYGNARTTIEKAAGQRFGVSMSMATVNQGATGMLCFKVDVVQNGGNLMGQSVAGQTIMFDGGSLTCNGNGIPPSYQFANAYYRNCTFPDLQSGNGAPLAMVYNERNQVVYVCGCKNTGGSGPVSGGLQVANDWNAVTGGLEATTPFANVDNVADGAILYNNRYINQGGPSVIASYRPITKGITILQCLFENAANIGPTLLLSGDGTTNQILNMNFAHNSVPSASLADQCNRFNHLYADRAVGVTKEGVFKFNLVGNGNMKTDTYQGDSPGVTGRTGNWAGRYKVGWLGNVYASDQGTVATASQDGNGWIGEVWFGVLTGAVIPWVNNKSGTNGTGGGDYHLVAGSLAENQVPAGLHVLTRDLGGATRMIDGTGAAGCYERPVGSGGGGGGGVLVD